MAGDARGFRGGFAGRVDSTSHSQQRGPLEFRPLYISEYSQSHSSLAAESGIVVGDGSARHLRGIGIGPRSTGDGDPQTQVALRHSRALGWRAGARGDRDVDVGSVPVENLE